MKLPLLTLTFTTLMLSACNKPESTSKSELSSKTSESSEAVVKKEKIQNDYEFVPEEAFNLPDDLEVQIWARTPMFYNPTNIDIDAKGRVWVSEAVNYRSFKKEKQKGLHFPEGDRVVVLEDTDKDGKADKSTVFVQDKDLVAPLGISVFDNEIFVASAPHLIRYTDVNRDLKFDPAIDHKEIFLTGFGGKDHDHSLHAFVAGPDGELYTATGNAGPSIVSDKAGWTLRSGSVYRGGSPYNEDNKPGLVSDDGRVWVGGLALRIKRNGTGMEVIGHNFRNSYELTVTSFGDVFQNDNDDPPACRTTWLMKYGNLGFFSADGSRTWNADRRPGQTIPTAQWRQEDPGTIPSGDVYGAGAPTGIAYYENGALGDKYNGMLLSAESGMSVIFGYKPQAKGAGFELERFDFFRSVEKDGVGPKDIHSWFRPSDVTVGADGAIYVADWHDPGVGGHNMSDPKSAGTIYRIVKKGTNPQTPEIDFTRIVGQLDGLKSPAPSVRLYAFENLVAQGDAVADRVANMLNNANPYIATRAIWVLARLGEKGQAKAASYLKAPNAQTRIATMRAILSAQPERRLELVKMMHKDSSVSVRREVALIARDLEWTEKKQILVELAKHYDGEDRWYLEALGTAAENHEQEFYTLLKKNLQPGDATQWSKQFLGLAWRLHPPSTVKDFLARAFDDKLDRETRRHSLDALAFISTKEAAMAMVKITLEGPEDLRVYSDWWVRNRSLSHWKQYNPVALLPKTRPMQQPVEISIEKAAYESEFLAKKSDLEKIELDVSGANRLYLHVESEDPGHNSNYAVWANGYFEDDNGNKTKLVDLPWLAANTKKGIIQKNHTGQGKLLKRNRKEIEGFGVLAPSTIFYNLSGKSFKKFYVEAAPDTQVRRNKSRGDDLTFSMKFKIFHDGGNSSTEKQPLAKIKDISKLKGNVLKGQELFYGRGICYTCHKIQGKGSEIGPDLTAIASKFGTDYLLDSLINPSSAITFGYETINVSKKDGSSVNGFLIADADPIIIRDLAGKEYQIPLKEIESKSTSEVSMMPSAEGLGLSGQELMDIIAYLQSIH